MFIFLCIHLLTHEHMHADTHTHAHSHTSTFFSPCLHLSQSVSCCLLLWANSQERYFVVASLLHCVEIPLLHSRDSIHQTNNRLLQLLSDSVHTYVEVEDTINRRLHTMVAASAPRPHTPTHPLRPDSHADLVTPRGAGLSSFLGVAGDRAATGLERGALGGAGVVSSPQSDRSWRQRKFRLVFRGLKVKLLVEGVGSVSGPLLLAAFSIHITSMFWLCLPRAIAVGGSVSLGLFFVAWRWSSWL